MVTELSIICTGNLYQFQKLYFTADEASCSASASVSSSNSSGLVIFGYFILALAILIILVLVAGYARQRCNRMSFTRSKVQPASEARPTVVQYPVSHSRTATGMPKPGTHARPTGATSSSMVGIDSGYSIWTLPQLPNGAHPASYPGYGMGAPPPYSSH